MFKNMDMEEIDSWYEEEKQKCLDEYIKGIETTHDFDKTEKMYNAKLEKIMKKYNRLMSGKLEHKDENKLKKIIKHVRSKLLPVKK
jgi:hypothetical protein